MLSRVVWCQALIIGAAEYAFLRPREDLRQVGKRFAGELALIVISARPLGLRNPGVIYHNANNESLLSFYVKGSIMGGKS